MTGPDDLGTHTVCAKMNPDFLEYKVETSIWRRS